MSSSDQVHSSLLNRIYDINEKDFDTVAADVWRYQFKNNKIYRSYCQLLGIESVSCEDIAAIPFLPISMFRDHEVMTCEWSPEKVFRSSGTTGALPSRHFIRDLGWYHRNARKCWGDSVSDPGFFTWIGLLPSYLEREDSSLIDMVNDFIQASQKSEGGFYSHISEQLLEVIDGLFRKGEKTVLIGVSFALLNLMENHTLPVWDGLIVVETGGMKGRGPEITREELHARLKARHPGIQIISEYGMTELLSQAYMVNKHFHPGHAMKIFTRDISDPLRILPKKQRGGINVIDLANIDSCSFIATDDIGIVYDDGSFDVLGRTDHSDIRGCNLMYA